MTRTYTPPTEPTPPPSSTDARPPLGVAHGPTFGEHPSDPPRRPLAAGHVIVVGLVCLLVGWFLNAPGIRKTAQGQSVGTKRDIATFFADGVYDVSHALFIDRLRVGLQDALGRSGDDDLKLSLPSPTVPPTATTTTTRPAFSPAKPLRVWLGGDSLSATPGESVINKAPNTQVIDTIGGIVDFHISTGLARPEVFNWPDHLRQVLAQDNPDALLLTIGSNDDQTLTGEGGVGPALSDAWRTEYARRVGGLMDLITANGKRRLFWVGIPIISDLARSRDHYKLMNDIVKYLAAQRPGRVYFIDTYSMFAQPDGTYSDFVNGVLVRGHDGIHYTREGGDLIADEVLRVFNRVYDLTTWQTTTTAAPRSASTTKAK